MSNPTWQDITPLPKSILLYFGDDPDYSAEQIEAAYRLLQRQAEEHAGDPLLCRRKDITGAEVLAILERKPTLELYHYTMYQYWLAKDWWDRADKAARRAVTRVDPLEWQFLAGVECSTITRDLLNARLI